MTNYRLYLMNNRTGHIDQADHIQAVHDLHGIFMAESVSDHRPMELWCGNRKVHRFETTSTALWARARAAALVRGLDS
jgi:hypothetical protein